MTKCIQCHDKVPIYCFVQSLCRLVHTYVLIIVPQNKKHYNYGREMEKMEKKKDLQASASQQGRSFVPMVAIMFNLQDLSSEVHEVHEI